MTVREGEARELRWAVVGTGGIAEKMAAALEAEGRRFYSAANRTTERAREFAARHGIEKVYEKMEEAFSDPEVDIIYLSTMHNVHYKWIMRGLEAGKHLLVEKPITLNSRQLREAMGLARERGLVLAEAMTVWHMPLYKELWAMKERGELGNVQLVTANFGSFKEYDMGNRFFKLESGGGALLDLGVYALSGIRSFLSCQPTRLASQMRPAPTGVDEQETVLLMNEAGEQAMMTVSLHSKQPNRLMVSFDSGCYLDLLDYSRGDHAVLFNAVTGERREIAIGSREDAFRYEFLDMEKAVRSGDERPMRLEWTLAVNELMTQLREEWGLHYPEEE